jgi:CelD/BcsL family acetyltransferase involved in cellulose biosynthesis
MLIQAGTPAFLLSVSAVRAPILDLGVGTSTIDVSSPEWFKFAAGHPAATAFHHPGWTEVLARAYGYAPGVFTLRSGEGRIVAGLPFMEVHSRLTGSRRVALPFTDHSPPLSEPGWELELAAAVRDWASAGAPLEVHARMSPEDEHVVSAGVRHLLPLDDADEIRARLSKTPIGRALRKADRSGLTTSIERDLDGVEAYYKLHCLTRQRQGVPVQPWRFFRLLHHRLIASGLGMVVLASLNGRPVAGGIFLGWNSTLIYKFGASDQAFWDLRPNNAVMWQAIEWGCANGFHTLDFGKTDADNVGLRQFKSGWGAQEVPLSFTVLPSGGGRDGSGFAMRAASRLIRRSPVIAARAIGELFYGHMA